MRAGASVRREPSAPSYLCVDVFFSQGVAFSAGEFETPKMNIAFQLLQDLELEKPRMVSPTGFEPVSSP